MKKTLALILALCMLVPFAACAHRGDYSSEGEGLNIITTLFPAYDFAREIAGERAKVTLLVPPGSDVHSFEPAPRDIIAIESCDLLIYNGGESEAWLEELLEGRDKDINSLSMLDCVDALEEEHKEGMQDAHEHEHEEHEEHEEEYDEHVWTSPKNAVLICRALTDKLCELDGQGSGYYMARCAQYVKSLLELDRDFRAVVEQGRLDTLIFADRFPVRYFVEEYGLDYYAAFSGCADDAEPSARTVAFLIDRVRELKAPYVMYIEYSNEKMADVIMEDTGCGKLLFHSCHNLSADDFKSGVTYMQLMRANLEALREALG